MRLSLVIASRDRAGQVREALARLNLAAMSRLGVDLVLVDSASGDNTSAVMAQFAQGCGVAAQVFRADRSGASRARNIGARAARGDVLIFTDDDCYLDPSYFDVIEQQFAPDRFAYGGGDTKLFDPSDAHSAVTHLDEFDRAMTIPPGTLLPSGMIQAANMIFQRRAFEQLGGFDERLGPGTPFPCEDIELCTRASLSGLAGVLIPDAKVLHHHRRRHGTAQLMTAELGYNHGRGAYFAMLLARGQKGRVFDLWSKGPHFTPAGPMSPAALTILMNEMRGAADYLETVLAKVEPGG